MVLLSYYLMLLFMLTNCYKNINDLKIKSNSKLHQTSFAISPSIGPSLMLCGPANKL